MAVYAVGDIQGCYEALARLLDKLRFDPGRDRLWLVGDLVNRGPQSLETLRFVRSLGDAALTVLGNHDLSLLAAAAGLRAGRGHTLDMHAVLNAADGPELLDWLRHRPLLHHDPALGFTMVHAGIPPRWNLRAARARAAELEGALRGHEYREFLEHMRGDSPAAWSEELDGWERLRFICNAFTRMRYCTLVGELDFTTNGTPGSQPTQLKPWFMFPVPDSARGRIVFGHWSTLGRYARGGVYGLDSGCVWGGELSALRLDLPEPRFHHVRCPGALTPGEDG